MITPHPDERPQEKPPLDPEIQSILIPMLEVVEELAQKNIGAIQVIKELVTNIERIDPENGHPLFYLLLLGAFEIQGEDLWILFNHRCGCDIGKMLTLLRACQMDLITTRNLQKMACHPNSPHAIHWDNLVKGVRRFLPHFWPRYDPTHD